MSGIVAVDLQFLPLVRRRPRSVRRRQPQRVAVQPGCARGRSWPCLRRQSCSRAHVDRREAQRRRSPRSSRQHRLGSSCTSPGDHWPVPAASIIKLISQRPSDAQDRHLPRPDRRRPGSLVGGVPEGEGGRRAARSSSAARVAERRHRLRRSRTHRSLDTGLILAMRPVSRAVRALGGESMSDTPEAVDARSSTSRMACRAATATGLRARARRGRGRVRRHRGRGVHRRGRRATIRRCPASRSPRARDRGARRGLLRARARSAPACVTAIGAHGPARLGLRALRRRQRRSQRRSAASTCSRSRATSCSTS